LQVIILTLGPMRIRGPSICRRYDKISKITWTVEVVWATEIFITCIR